MADMPESLAALKQSFAETYSGQSNMQEVIPSSASESFPIEAGHLELLHRFVSESPIYYNSHAEEIGGVRCIVYEGDINRFWLGSIQHKSSGAPFSPTWMLSAYLLARMARDLGAAEAVDIGSGDGRIAYCAGILGIKPYSIEIDPALAGLQTSLARATGVDFGPICADATRFDYSGLGLRRPAFFIGGLAQMGGLRLAGSVLGAKQALPPDHMLVLAGTNSPKYAPDGMSMAGWGRFISENGLIRARIVMLPTAWTFREPEDTAYLFVRPDRNPH